MERKQIQVSGLILFMWTMIGWTLIGCNGRPGWFPRFAESRPAAAQSKQISPHDSSAPLIRFPDNQASETSDVTDPQVTELTDKVKQFEARLPASGVETSNDQNQLKQTPGNASGESGRLNNAVTSTPKPAHLTAVMSSPPAADMKNRPQTAAKNDKTLSSNKSAGTETSEQSSSKIPAPANSVIPNNSPIELIDIRPSGSTEGQPVPTDPSSNRPVPETSSGPQQADIATLIGRLEKSIHQNPRQIDDLVKLRLLYLATGQNQKAMEPAQGLDPIQGETLSTLFRAFAATQDTLRNPSNSTTTALSAVTELQRLVSEQSPVIIPKVAMVTRIDDFGNYESVKMDNLESGRPLHFYLYTEVANLRSEPVSDGRIRTLLSAQVEIFDHSGKVLWQRTFSQIEDRTLSPRRDFFVPLEVKLPSETPAGEYVLKVTIEDKLGATTDQQRLTFRLK